MAYRRGFGACYGQTASVLKDPGAVWDYILHGCPTLSVAPPRAPSGDVLTVPPASGVDAQATVDALLDQQMRDQQALDADGVKSSWLDSLASDVVDTGDAITNPKLGGVSAWVWLVGGLGLFAVVAMGGGKPRRYGR
jgi:hypothetical protein